MAGDAAKLNKKKRINPRHIMLAVKRDTELDQLLHGVTFADGGVVPHINPVLLPKTTQRKDAPVP